MLYEIRKTYEILSSPTDFYYATADGAQIENESFFFQRALPQNGMRVNIQNEFLCVCVFVSRNEYRHRRYSWGGSCIRSEHFFVSFKKIKTNSQQTCFCPCFDCKWYHKHVKVSAPIRIEIYRKNSNIMCIRARFHFKKYKFGFGILNSYFNYFYFHSITKFKLNSTFLSWVAFLHRDWFAIKIFRIITRKVEEVSFWGSVKMA